MVLVGLLVLLLCLVGTLIGGWYINEHTYGEASLCGFVLMLIWLICTLALAVKLILT
jgi:hypothetical protein